jgi:hypothetical protein
MAILTVGAHGTPQTESCTTPRLCRIDRCSAVRCSTSFRGARDLQSLRNQIDPRATMASSATRELR